MARTPGHRGCAVHKFWVYDDLTNNPKYMLLPDETKVFLLMVWCIASTQTVRNGTLPSVLEVAFRARCTLSHAEAQLNALASTGWVEFSGGQFHVCRWLEFQGEAVSKAERQRRYRQRKLTEKQEQTSQIQARGATRGATVARQEALQATDRKKERALLSEASSEFRSSTPQKLPQCAPPQPPERGEARGLASQDDEPFHPPSDPTPPPDAAPPEVVEVERLADELFPSGGIAPFARRACLDGVKPAWVVEALRIARDAKATRWKFVETILNRFQAAGASDAERATAKPRGRASPHPNANILTADPKLAELRRNFLAKEGRIHEPE